MKMLHGVVVLLYCGIGCFSIAPATPIEEFNDAAAVVLSLTGAVESELEQRHAMEPFIETLQSALKYLLDCWQPLTPADRDELEHEVDNVSKSILDCFTFLKQRYSPELPKTKPELFLLLRQFVAGEIQDFFAAVDADCECDAWDEAESLLLSIRDSVGSRENLSKADKWIVINLADTYLREIAAEREGMAAVTFSGSVVSARRNAICQGLPQGSRQPIPRLRLPSGRHLILLTGDVEVSAFDVDAGNRGDDVPDASVCWPHDPEALLLYIAQSLLTAEILIRERRESGGAGSSEYEPPPIQSLLNDIHRTLAAAPSRGCDPAAIARLEAQLGELEKELE
jgi:hypothetical protein